VDPDPGGPKTCGSIGSGFGSGSTTLLKTQMKIPEVLIGRTRVGDTIVSPLGEHDFQHLGVKELQNCI
jgi:hypothetical protein